MARSLSNLFAPKSITSRKPKPSRPPLNLDSLENRALPATSLTASFDYADGVLRIEGTPSADQIRIVNNADQLSVAGLAIRSTNSGPVWTNVPSIAAADIRYVDVRALAGNDRVEVVQSNFTPEIAPPTSIHGQEGNDTLIGGSAADGLYGGTGNDVLNGRGGADHIEAGYSGDTVGALAAQLDRDLGFYAAEKYDAENAGGRGEKWFYGHTPDAGYFILPNGEVYRSDNTYQPDGTDVPALVAELKVFYNWANPERTPAASGTLIATLDPSYHQNLLKLANASVLTGALLAQEPLGPQAAQLDRDLGLVVEGEEDFFGGQMERWLLDGRVPFAETEERTDCWYYILPNGELYRWDGSWDVLGGTLLATFDASFYQELTKLTDAQYLFGDLVDNDSAGGDAGNDTIIGGDGSDTLNGGLMDDRLVGGNDNDSLRGEQGNDELFGAHVASPGESGNPNDTIVGNAGDDSLYGGDGADRMEGDNGNDYLKGDGGNDSLFGGYTDATSETGVANDTIEGGDGSDLLYGGVGEDTLIGQNDNDWIQGGRGNDLLLGAFIDSSAETGSNRGDTIFGENGTDRIYGGEGDDNLSGGNDNDDMYGEQGNDLMWGAFWNTNVETGNTRDTLYGGDGSDRLFGGYGHDNLSGGNDNDDIHGASGNDSIWGAFADSPVETGNANDTLTGGHGADTILGGQGNDTLDGGWQGTNPEVGEMNDLLDGGDGNDLLWGGEGRDALTGGHGADSLNGERGMDDLDGGLRGFDPEIGFANDVLDGGPEDDLMWGGEGDDSLTGGRGQDTLNGESGNDILDGGLPFTESEGAFGSWDRLDGGEGNDLMWGGEGNDTLEGGLGNDTLNGESGSDRMLGGEGSDTLRGFAGNDRMFGEGGNDTLYGGAGRDTLDGGFGQDGIFGGTLDARDDLFGGPDPDRILSADDNDLDRTDEDALLHFFGLGTVNFNDLEIEELDKGFGWLHTIRGNPALLKLQDGGMIRFQRVIALESANTLADNNNEGRIRMANWAFENLYNPTNPRHNIPAEATALHELGHNWDGFDDEDGGMNDFIESEWFPLSGWESDGIGASGKEESLDGDWLYNFDAIFVRNYGRNNPLDDWCTTWEAAYVWNAYPGNSNARLPYNYFGTELKIELVNRFFAGNF